MLQRPGIARQSIEICGEGACSGTMEIDDDNDDDDDEIGGRVGCINGKYIICDRMIINLLAEAVLSFYVISNQSLVIS